MLPTGTAAAGSEAHGQSGLRDCMREPLRIRERPPQSGVVALLEAEGLPAQDALLRSLVVSAVARTQGLGSALVLHAEEYAATHQVRALYLLTNTSETYFEHRGYRRIDRAEAPSSIQSTRQFANLCPSSSACMIKRL
jgi:N-acetylglutamate synthase-like GNAT family acetyltransferase